MTTFEPLAQRPDPVCCGIDADELAAAAHRAARAIPPMWPLRASVAVNPYLGQAHETLAQVCARLARVAGAPVTMPRAWYRDRIASGAIDDRDLATACATAERDGTRFTVDTLKRAAMCPGQPPEALPTVASLAAQVSGVDWPAIIAERFGVWAAGYFDEGQALWSAPRGPCAYSAWRAVATHDLTPEILGLRRFATFVSDAPQSRDQALLRYARQLNLSTGAAETYFHQLLVTLGGWAHYARYKLWQAELGGGTDGTLIDFLAIRLLWDAALLAQYRAHIGDQWAQIVVAHTEPLSPSIDQHIDAILQEAAEHAAQRHLADTLAVPVPPRAVAVPVLQAAFCIDVRSEVFRRALESVDPRVQTLGFAGFFGVGAAHRRFASDVVEHRLPVLLNPGLTTRAGDADDDAADRAARFKARAVRAWGRFKLAAVSSFAFVEAAGPLYAAKLLRDALGLAVSSPPSDPPPHPDPALDLSTRAAMAEKILRAMSLTHDFAPLVLLVGHGATVTNNPHASALQCGACGGHAGDVNARLLAHILNDTAVRARLGAVGIVIPAETLFVGALHDTTTDHVTLYADDHPAPDHRDAIDRARQWLATAGVLARSERALRLPRAQSGGQVARRSRDWAETRPEWALAGCNAFIAAPRARTAGKNLGGRAFLHDYDWQRDTGFGVLELIMTAPVIVASWISLGYYGAVVAPALFGGGNKLLHNIVGGIGVIEGNGGPLRTGPPWQSVHDSRALAHEPLRLTVCIEAPCAAMSDILTRHPGVRALFDQRWLHLFALDGAGRMAFRYRGDLAWDPISGDVMAALPESQRSHGPIPAADRPSPPGLQPEIA